MSICQSHNLKMHVELGEVFVRMGYILKWKRALTQ